MTVFIDIKSIFSTIAFIAQVIVAVQSLANRLISPRNNAYALIRAIQFLVGCA